MTWGVFRFRRHIHMPTIIATRTLIPPTAPPIIGPIGVFFSWGTGCGLGGGVGFIGVVVGGCGIGAGLGVVVVEIIVVAVAVH